VEALGAFRAIHRARLIGWAVDPLPRVAGLAILLACSPLSLHPQGETASLTGVVQDPSGAVIGGNSSVVLEPAGGGVRRETQSDERGVFRFSGLWAGPYTLSIRVPGFDSVKVKQDLLAGEQRSLPPIRLNVGSSGCFSTDPDPERTRFLSAGLSTGGLAGNVKSGLGPVAGARVSLACWLDRGCSENPERTKTDSQGDFEFENIRPGRYLLSVEQDRFFPLVSMGFGVVGGLESSYSFNLTPCPNGDCTVKLDRGKVKVIVCE